jgi:hypothetical protein
MPAIPSERKSDFLQDALRCPGQRTTLRMFKRSPRASWRNYVTAEMTGADVGQKTTSSGKYELMICARQDLPKAADLISKLARYTCDAEIKAGQTMDLPKYFGDSTIRALLFAPPCEEPIRFEFLGQRYSLLLCIGITDAELSFARSQGGGKLLPLLKQHGIFPYTTPDRSSVPLPDAG